MAADEFDVHLIGARDPNPSGHLRLAATIASRYRVGAPAVAAALAGTSPCRIGHRLSAADAQALVDALVGLGAVARSSGAGAPVGQAAAQSPDHLTGHLTDPGSGVRVPDRRITLKSADAHAAPVVVDVAEPMEFAEPGPDGRTGVRGADVVRCPIHGLAYNRRQASGCVRCLAPARARAKTLETAGTPASSGPDAQPPERAAAPASSGAPWFRERFASPARRALWGVVVAVAIGFLPAAYHARASTRRKALELRAEQTQVAAAAPATVATLARFDALDAQVDAVHLHGAGETLLIWLAVAGAAGLVWSKVT